MMRSGVEGMWFAAFAPVQTPPTKPQIRKPTRGQMDGHAPLPVVEHRRQAVGEQQGRQGDALGLVLIELQEEGQQGDEDQAPAHPEQAGQECRPRCRNPCLPGTRRGAYAYPASVRDGKGPRTPRLCSNGREWNDRCTSPFPMT